MSVYQIDPLSDERWRQFLQGHSLASVFHSVEWLTALKATYGYKPTVLTTTPPGRSLENGLVYCRVSSWLTGYRYVSLPFSDHCQPLISGPGDLSDLLVALASELRKRGGRYAEIRIRNAASPGEVGYQKSREFFFHELDLSPTLEEIFHGFHKNSIQRKIRRAEREGLTLEEGRSEILLDKFYSLILMTRRRHGIPPPPREWFKSLLDEMGAKLNIRVASHGDYPIASILTLSFKNSLVYKYGGSDPKFHRLGGMQALFWQSINAAKHEGLKVFDLGRTDVDNHGLITFKGRWGATCSRLTNYRHVRRGVNASAQNWSGKIVRSILPYVPAVVLNKTGKLLYKHVG